MRISDWSSDVCSSEIESAIEILADRNLVAKDWIGITGLSDGCTTAKFAAINSDKFAAGSVSGCGLEPEQDAVLGPMIAQLYHDSGWPRLIDKIGRATCRARVRT